MTFNLTEPNPGDRIGVDLIREIIRAIRALKPISGHRMRTSTGPNGTVYDVKDVPGKKETKKGCGRYDVTVSLDAEEEPSEGATSSGPRTATLTFANPYYRVGGKTYTGSETEIEDVELPAIVALKVDITESTPTDEIVSYSTLSGLQAAETDEDYYIHPLYKIDSAGLVVCDFRIGPDSAQWEFGGQPS